MAASVIIVELVESKMNVLNANSPLNNISIDRSVTNMLRKLAMQNCIY